MFSRKNITFVSEHIIKQVCVEPSTAAVNATLLAFAAERRAAAALLLQARRAAVHRYHLPTELSA